MSNKLRHIPWPGWEKVREIGEGSFGTVYEIKHDLFGDEERAALKIISIPRSKSEIKSLRAEAQDAEAITQTIEDQAKRVVGEYNNMRKLEWAPNIVRCNEVHREAHLDGLGYDIYIKMELLVPLLSQVDEHIQQVDELIRTEDQIVHFGIDMCHALVACEQKGILHRDIKPENVFVSRDGVFKLGDFGVARSLDHTTYATKGVGTPPYMAPEIAKGEEYNKQADIYSLGIMLYWLLNKRRTPFLPLPPEGIRASDRENAFRRRCAGEQIPAPVNGSKELQRIVLKACAFNLSDRYQSAQAMLEELQNLADPGYVRVIPLVPEVDVQRESTDPNGEAPNGSVISNGGTVGPVPSQPQSESHIQTIGPDSEWLKKQKEEQQRIESQKRKEFLTKVVFGVLGIVLVILLILLLLRSCSGNTEPRMDEIAPSESIVDTMPTENSAEENAFPEQLDWSNWMEELPSYVSEDIYEIEEQTLYRSRTLETTESTTQKKIKGWELYHTAEGTGDFGAWSNWSATKVTGSDTRQVETQQRYRYRTKETTTGSTSTMSGWTLYDTTYAWSNYGSWSSWSTTQTSASDSRQVETKTQYRYRDMEYTTSSNSSMDGWTLLGTVYGAWGADQSTTSKPAENDMLRITSSTQTKWGYYHYCNVYPNGGNGYNLDSIPYGSESHYHGCSTTFALPAVSFADKGGAQAYGGTGSGAPGCGWNFYYWFRNSGADEYTYTYQTRNATYKFGKMSDSWSSWSDTAVSASSTREVETRTVYRYRDREEIPTYHFWRWGAWSNWSQNAISSTDARDVETSTYYRYRDRVTETTYYFRKWTDWTEYTNETVVASDTVEVETVTQYRYKQKSE